MENNDKVDVVESQKNNQHKGIVYAVRQIMPDGKYSDIIQITSMVSNLMDISSVLSRRIEGLEYDGGVKIVLLAVVVFDDRRDAFKFEATAHRIFAEYRRRGEWFATTPDSVMALFGMGAYGGRLMTKSDTAAAGDIPIEEPFRSPGRLPRHYQEEAA